MKKSRKNNLLNKICEGHMDISNVDIYRLLVADELVQEGLAENEGEHNNRYTYAPTAEGRKVVSEGGYDSCKTRIKNNDELLRLQIKDFKRIEERAERAEELAKEANKIAKQDKWASIGASIIGAIIGALVTSALQHWLSH